MVEDQDAFGGVRFIDPTREVHRRRCWQRWLERMTTGSGVFTLEMALPKILQAAFLETASQGFRLPFFLRVVFQPLEDRALSRGAWNAALAAARSGEPRIWDDVAVSNWAANVLATLRRAEDDGDDDDDDGF